MFLSFQVPRDIACLRPWLTLFFMHLDMVLKPPPKHTLYSSGAFSSLSLLLGGCVPPARQDSTASAQTSLGSAALVQGAELLLTRNPAAGHECKKVGAPSEGEPEIRLTQSLPGVPRSEICVARLLHYRKSVTPTPGILVDFFLKAESLSTWSPENNSKCLSNQEQRASRSSIPVPPRLGTLYPGQLRSLQPKSGSPRRAP